MSKRGEPLEEKKMTFMEHTVELFQRLKIILIAVFGLGIFVGFFPLDITKFFAGFFGFWPSSIEYTPLVSLIFERLKKDLLPKEASLIAGSFLDTAYVYLMLSILIGVVLSSPIIAYELYKFFNPALYQHERKLAAKIILSFVGLFFMGGFLCYKAILPITFKILMWFIKSAGALPLININDFVQMILVLIIGVGLLYTSPIYITLLVQKGVMSSEYLTKNRKFIYGAFIIIAAIVTPDPTIVSDIILLMPFIVLYEVTVFICKHIEKKSFKEGNALINR
ncbi:preprotein translocase subunit TatC [Candidatus Bathyarchaeota archaeon]|nr:preprotein translocase subunit TatC [Candidatus Bathyarchaeota archaeon]